MDPVTASIAKRRAARNTVRLAALRKRFLEAPPARAFAGFLATLAGAALMRWLEEEFVFGDLLGEDPEETAFNLGLRQFVIELRLLQSHIATGEKTNDPRSP